MRSALGSVEFSARQSPRRANCTQHLPSEGSISALLSKLGSGVAALHDGGIECPRRQ